LEVGLYSLRKNSVGEVVCIRARVYSCRKSRKISVGLYVLRKNSRGRDVLKGRGFRRAISGAIRSRALQDAEKLDSAALF
jgi:hypothetical protein